MLGDMGKKQEVVRQVTIAIAKKCNNSVPVFPRLM
jgi:ribosomal protein L39E